MGGLLLDGRGDRDMVATNKKNKIHQIKVCWVTRLVSATGLAVMARLGL
jgi:hypothetical protein